MTNILTLLKKLKALGIKINVEENRLVLWPGSAVPEELKSDINKLGPDLFILLNAQLNGLVIWKGKPSEYRALLILRQAELELAKANLTGNSYADWFISNRIGTLNDQISHLERCLTNATKDTK